MNNESDGFTMFRRNDTFFAAVSTQPASLAPKYLKREIQEGMLPTCSHRAPSRSVSLCNSVLPALTSFALERVQLRLLHDRERTIRRTPKTDTDSLPL